MRQDGDLGAVGWTAGGFELRVSGDKGPDYLVLTSTNLLDWDTLCLTNSPALPFAVTDPEASALPQRFYRVLMGPPLL
jgi:hypothetical protein